MISVEVMTLILMINTFIDVLKKCDKLLVEADNFYQFRGLILCNMNHLQFDWYKKEHICTV